MNYKDFEKRYIGGSDIAALIVAAPGFVDYLHFDGDGGYDAYIIPADIDIPAHYTEVLSGNYWLKIYDDDGLTYAADAAAWKIYRAGGYGVIIQLIDRKI